MSPADLVQGIRSLLGTSAQRRLSRWKIVSRRILALEAETGRLSEEELQTRSLALCYRAQCGEPLRRLVTEAFALVREAASRQLGMKHYPVQLLGGLAMSEGCIAEMQTGEGKTLTATLPLYLHAMAGRGAHLATANDYLAGRDGEWMRPVFESLGLTAGVVQSGMSSADRRAAYACSITYGTAREFGFDFLRDRLLGRSRSDGMSALLFGQPSADTGEIDSMVRIRTHFALIDEADSILIDEARTPLIISSLSPEETELEEACYLWAASVAPRFLLVDHVTHDPVRRQYRLTAAGRSLVHALEKPQALNPAGQLQLYEFVERAVRVEHDFQRDRHYIVREGEVVIVDEFTGRLAEGRKWRSGLHQAVEAREGLPPSVQTGQAARVTVQELFAEYTHFAGMTGTASSAARELKQVYGSPVSVIPTAFPKQREVLAPRVLPDAASRRAAVVSEIREVLAQGRPVLVGTRSIDRSEELSAALAEAGIAHEVLHARHIDREAEIVARAGQPGRVTVATNMAGRGTDIKLDEDVAKRGGLHVIATELHDSSRIDRQLFGRCARQRDPGTCRQYVSLEDDVLKNGLGEEAARKFQHRSREGLASGSIRSVHLIPQFLRAQRLVERKHARQRKMLMHFVSRRNTAQHRMGQDPYLDTPS